MKSNYKKVFEFKVDEDELDRLRDGMRIALKAKDNSEVDGTAKVLAKLNKVAEGKNEWQRRYHYDE